MGKVRRERDWGHGSRGGEGRVKWQKVRRESQQEVWRGNGCNQSKRGERSKGKGPQQREELSLHKNRQSSPEAQGSIWEVVSPLSLGVCKQGCMNL